MLLFLFKNNTVLSYPTIQLINEPSETASTAYQKEHIWFIILIIT